MYDVYGIETHGGRASEHKQKRIKCTMRPGRPGRPGTQRIPPGVYPSAGEPLSSNLVGRTGLEHQLGNPERCRSP